MAFGAMALLPDERRSRLLRHAAEDGIFFPLAGQGASALAHPGDEPGAAGSLVDAVLALVGNVYVDLFTYVMFMMVLSYALLTVAGLFVLRRKQPDTPRPYRCTGYPWVPAIYMQVLGSLWAINAVIAVAKSNLKWRRDCCAGRTIVFLLEETEGKHRHRATTINQPDFSCRETQGPRLPGSHHEESWCSRMALGMTLFL